MSDTNQSTQPRPNGNWIGHKMANQYLCTRRSILDTHRSSGHVILLTENLTTDKFKGLMINVRMWKEIVFKLQFKERADVEFLPFNL